MVLDFPRRYIDVCYCDIFSGVNVYLDHLKFCGVCINSRRYICCSECSVSAPRPILGVDAPSVLCCFLGAELSNLPRVWADIGGFPFCLSRVYEEQLSDLWSRESHSWVLALEL